MSVTAKALINAQQVTASDATYYTVPAATTTIIDKFTATNVTAGAVTLNVNLVASGGSAGVTNLVIDVLSIAANSVTDLTQLQNQILSTGDFISCKASAGSSIVIRGSGREIT